MILTKRVIPTKKPNPVPSIKLSPGLGLGLGPSLGLIPIRQKIFSKDMARIAIMIGGVVLNAATFIGGNYLARALGGDSSQAALEEKKRHDKALEAYQAAYNKLSRERTQLLDWIETNAEIHA